jgi:putative ABC transport system permease protein
MGGAVTREYPNYFLINIRSQDVDGIRSFLRVHQIEASTPYALVRARMSQINSVDVDKIDFSHPGASHSVTHTYNLTYADEVPDQNKIVEGRWLNQNPGLPQMSVEQGMAEKLDLKLGDQLTMTVGSKVLQAEVTSIRSVVWENFKPNFYLIANPGLLESFPQTWLLSALIADPT